MEKYICTKTVEAEPATRGDYNEFRGWTIPADENPDDEGYLVKYSDGYISWSPKKQFEEAYKKSGEMSFGHAIEIMKKGGRVQRIGWNGKNQYIELASKISYVNPYDYIVNAAHEVIGNKAIAFVGTSGVQLGWVASQADMLAEDWKIL